MGATIVDNIASDMTLAREEVFGPVLNVMRMADLDHAIEQANLSGLSGMARPSFTNSGARPRSSSTASKPAWSA